MPDYLTPQNTAWLLGLIVVIAPALLVAILGVSSLLDSKLSEPVTGRVSQIAIVVGLLATLGVLAFMLATEDRHVVVDLGDWIKIGEHYHFSVKFLFDKLSVPLVLLSYVLCGTIGAFANRYLHREPGFNRFFVLYAVFLLGMVVTALSGTIETLFTGWELVGLSSALLIAFFQERPAPARNGLRVWVVYRVSDAALLFAAVVMHHLAGQGDFDLMLGNVSWPEQNTSLPEQQALLVGLLLLVAAAGKSALVPFSGWLPRAMEGPTPSSAVFYGALSVHLGAYLLLRVSPLLEKSIWLAVAVISLGLITAAFASLTGRVQTDIKSALSFASLAQVGLIVAEIGLVALPLARRIVTETGIELHYLPLIHLLGHACLRTLQFVRAPALLQDYRALENAIGARLPRPGPTRWLPERMRSWIYRLALERGYLDAYLSDYVYAPFVRLFRWCDTLERQWTDFLSGSASRESDQVKPHVGTMEELL